MTARNQHVFARIPHPRYVLFVAVSLIAAWPLGTMLPLGEAVASVFDLGVAGFVLSCVPLWLHGGPESIRRQARRDDFGEIPLLLLTGLISTIILFTLVELKAEVARSGMAGVALVVGTLIASWVFTNLIFAFHYARLYYSQADEGDREGLSFPGSKPPEFPDFVNFAFVVGMTCQTADIAITSPHIRRVSTFHGLFAFAFNLGILALSVNMLASQG
jgi:uncharacterized membrane protein